MGSSWRTFEDRFGELCASYSLCLASVNCLIRGLRSCVRCIKYLIIFPFVPFIFNVLNIPVFFNVFSNLILYNQLFINISN